MLELAGFIMLFYFFFFHLKKKKKNSQNCLFAKRKKEITELTPCVRKEYLRNVWKY